MTSNTNKRTYGKKRGWVKKKSAAFVTSPPVKKVGRYTLSSINREINRQKEEFFRGRIKGKIEDILPESYKAHASFIAAAAETKITDTTVGIIDHLKEGIVNRGASKYGFFEKESLPPMNSDNAIQSPSTKVRTRFITGQPSTSSVTKMKDIFGSSVYKVFDTETDFQEDRQALNQHVGFNQKSFIMLSSVFTPNIDDYKEIFGIDKFSFPKMDDQVAYGLATHERVRLKLSNLNKYLPLNIDVHLIEMKDRELTGSMLFEYVFHKDVTHPSTSGKIPIKYQFKDLNSVKNKTGDILFTKSAIVSKRARLEMSAAFRQNATVVKTFRRKLEAGQIWDLDLTTYLGPGLCLDQVFYDALQLHNTVDSQPSCYAIALECVGVDTTLIHSIKGVKQEHIGTSAGSFCFEFSKSIEVVNSNINLGTSGFENSKAGIKLYRRDISSGVDFNVDFDKISEAELKSNETGFYIPVRSNEIIEPGGPV